jgi:hypothetical protein
LDIGRSYAASCDILAAVKRAAALFLLALTTMLVAAPMAFADNGEGLLGKADDQTVTFFCFGVMAFFVILVIGMSLIQGALERRKARRRYDIERLG